MDDCDKSRLTYSDTTVWVGLLQRLEFVGDAAWSDFDHSSVRVHGCVCMHVCVYGGGSWLKPRVLKSKGLEICSQARVGGEEKYWSY